jgi:signal transduction histidine kinase
MFLIGILGILGSAYIWGALEYSRFQKETSKLRKDLLDTQKNKIKQQVESALQFVNYRKQQMESQIRNETKQRTYEAYKIASYIYNANKDKLSKNEIKKLIHDVLYPIIWDHGNGYYWIGSMQGTLILNHSNPEYEGKRAEDLNNIRGSYIMNESIRIASSQGEGYFFYVWNRPDKKNIISKKLAFVKYFKPMDWFIGNGKYFEDEVKSAQKDILNSFEHIKIGKEGYIFLGTYDGLSLTYPAKGKNVLEVTDSTGREFVREIIAIAKTGGGFISYVMPKFGNVDMKNKLSYIMGINDWKWYIGFGVYTDEIDKMISEKESQLYSSIKRRAINSIFLLLLLLVLAMFLAQFVAYKVSDDFNAFSLIVDQKNDTNSRVSEYIINFSEFQQMAKSINNILDEQEKYDLEKQQLEKKLNMAQKMEALGIMAGGVAHDLNNILSAVMNIPAFLLMEMKDDDPNREAMELMLDAGKRASSIVKDMLTIARGVVLKTTIENINNLIEQAVVSAEFLDLKKTFPNIKISLNLSKKPLYIDCSPPHINKMIYNLVNNGMESVQDNGEILILTFFQKVSKNKNDINEIPPGEYCLLKIKDNGCGMQDDELEKIFEPFYTKKKLGRSGTGLGLAVVWNTVSDHNAFIKVHSSSKGSVFEIYFPLKHYNIKKTISLNALSKVEKVQISESKQIFIVDDEAIQRTFLSKMLQKLGFKTKVFATGEELVGYLKNHSCDLLILDMMLGDGLNGRETYQEVLKTHPKQKAIVVTGYAMNEDVDETLKLGASACLHKPYTMQELTSVLEKAFS